MVPIGADRTTYAALLRLISDDCCKRKRGPASTSVYNDAEVDADASGLLKSFYGNLDGALLRLALAAELSAWAWRGGDEPREISLATIEAAAEWIDDYAKPMAQRVYGDASLPMAERNAATLARYIVKAGLHTINRRELRRGAGKASLPWARLATPVTPMSHWDPRASNLRRFGPYFQSK